MDKQDFLSLESHRRFYKECLIIEKICGIFSYYGLKPALRIEKDLCNKRMSILSNMPTIYLESLEYDNLYTVYRDILKGLSNYLKKFDCVSPMDIFCVYSFLIRNGYLSACHQFYYEHFSDKIFYILGSEIMSGKGVCRHITSFLTDLLNESGFSSCNITMALPSINMAKLSDVPYLEKEEEEFDAEEEEFDAENDECGKLEYNHLATLYYDDKNSYVLDPTNDTLFFVSKKGNVYPARHHDTIIDTSIMDVCNQNQTLKFSEIYRKTDLKEMDGMVESYLKLWNVCLDSTDSFETFWWEHKEMYQEVNARKKELIRSYQKLKNTILE